MVDEVMDDVVIQLLGVSLVSPGFALAGLGLMALPIVIHLLNKRRFRTVEWAAMVFLRRAMEKNRKRLRFEQWTVLAIRCLLIGLVGLALSRPMGCGGEGVGEVLGQRTGLLVVVIDNSYSMGLVPAGGGGGGAGGGREAGVSHLELARRMAERVVRQMGGGGRSVAVVTAGREAGVLLRPTYDVAAAVEAIGRVELGQGTTDLAGALGVAEELVREAGGVKGSAWVRVFTDGTRSSLDERSAARVRPVVGRLVGAADVAVYRLGVEGQGNAAAVDLAARGAVVTTRQPAEVVGRWMEAGVAGGAAVGGARAVWDGRGMREVGEVAGGEDVLRERGFVAGGGGGGGSTAEGAVVGTLTVGGGDALAVDDVMRRVFEVRGGVGVWVVAGERGDGGTPTSAGFVAMALMPPGAAGGGEAGGSRSVLVAEVLRDFEMADRLSGGRLTVGAAEASVEMRAVVLSSVGRVSAETAARLKAFVEGGGLLVNFLGEATDADAMNTAMLPAGLLPGAIGGRVERGGEGGDDAAGFEMGAAGLTHPLMAVFRGVENVGLDRARVRGYWKLDAGEKVERVLSYRPTGDAAILAHAVGRGRVITVTTSGGGDGWNDLPAKPAFVPLVNELVVGSISASDGWMTRKVGERLVVPAGVALAGTPGLRDEAGAEVGMRFVEGSGWTSEVLTKAGVYQLGDGARQWPVVVNVDALAEGDVRVLPAAAITEALGTQAVRILDAEMEGADGAAAEEAGAADFGWVLMLVVLGLVGAESFAAMWFGRR
jgi:hypothetical protein